MKLELKNKDFFKDVETHNSYETLLTAHYVDSMLETLRYFNLVSNKNITKAELKFWAKKIKLLDCLNIDLVKMDMLDKIDDYTISLKYFISLDTVKEIRDLPLGEHPPFLNTKLYSSNDLFNFFNIPIKRISYRRYLKSFYNTLDNAVIIKDRNSPFWTGEFIMKNLDKLSNEDAIRMFNGITYIKEYKAYDTIFGTHHIYNKLIRSNNKEETIFGVKIRYTDKENYRWFNLTDCIKAKENKNLYILSNQIESYNKHKNRTKKLIASAFTLETGKPFNAVVCLGDQWILKEDAIKLHELASTDDLTKKYGRSKTIASAWRNLDERNQKLAERCLKMSDIPIGPKEDSEASSYLIRRTDVPKLNKILMKISARYKVQRNGSLLSYTEVAEELNMAKSSLMRELNENSALFGIPVKIRRKKVGKGKALTLKDVNRIRKVKDEYVYFLDDNPLEKIFGKRFEHKRLAIREKFSEHIVLKYYIKKDMLEEFKKEIDEVYMYYKRKGKIE